MCAGEFPTISLKYVCGSQATAVRAKLFVCLGRENRQIGEKKVGNLKSQEIIRHFKSNGQRKMRVNVKTDRSKIVVNYEKSTHLLDRCNIPLATSLAILILSSVEIGFSRCFAR